MTDPASLAKTIESASKVANTPLFTTIIDKVTGFRLSKWAAEGEIRKKLIHDEYEKAKEGGIMGMQYIEYMRNTENLIDTAVKSSKYIDPHKSNDIKMDNDFFWNTIEHAKTVSSDEMQELVAKIIAGEYNEPGSYSMSTLQALKMLGKSELELFEKICSLCVNDHQIPQDVFSLPESLRPTLNSLSIDFGSLQSLQTLGLFLPNDMSRTLQNPEKKNFALSYFGKVIEFEPTHETSFEIKLPGFYTLSTTGKQIIKHLNPSYLNDYFEWLKENYKIPNYKASEK
ncbi:hypothetical protein BTO06_00390 [Tenacibaculum sp. SZ-18]|uniref:DUF2806 domain-containing protein n=1 Tax=Tenacibaculum sp. SZ-18 TaxID=754423 RepID=UPI000C2D2703|nr:DUF2806 domain-containing protein [Tenacibaculum sp. SZ-18]AUC13695.1 hypothetical protein BTO06_00390 [Tenacibaculum sp. SZ-18]